MIGNMLRRTGILSDREAELRAREKEMFDRLSTALERFGPDVSAEDLKRFRQVNNEVRDSSERINETIGPYRRFVRLQQEQLGEAQAELVTVENSLLKLKVEIER